MDRGTPFFIILVFFALGLTVSLPAGGQGQEGRSQEGRGQEGRGQEDQGSNQPKSAGSNSQNPPADSNVLILKAPEMPVQPQFTPELRTIDLEKRKKLDETTKMRLIQLLDAEFAHIRRYIALGDKSLVIDPRGRVTPSDAMMFQQIQSHGAVAKVGDKVQVTNVIFHEKSVYFEINGGPKRKTKWYQHISVGVGGAGGGVTPINGEEAPATGAAFTLQFSKPVPEMTPTDLKKLIGPVLDFSSKSAVEVYSETLPPKIRDAIKNHEVLVGMNREMVIMAKDHPQQKVRDKDDHGKDYEDWIYGKAPQNVVFVRIVGDEVVMVKIAKVGSPTITKTEKEVDVKDGVASLAALQASKSPQDAVRQPEEPAQPVHRPTLRREGEQEPSLQLPPADNGQDQPPHRSDEPEWGTKGKPEDKQPPAQDPPKPPQL